MCCVLNCSVLVVVDVIEVNLIMGARMDSLVVDVVEVNAIMGAGMHSLVSHFAVTNSNLAVVEVFSIYADAMTVDAHVT